MPQVLLITSAAYVDPELEAEFGKIPPAFLPLANRRLFFHQRAATVDSFDTILLSVPEDFKIDSVDQSLLDELGIQTVAVPLGLTLGNSLIYVFNLMALSRSSVSVLHGDTLIKNLPHIEDDAVSVVQVPAGYRWGLVKERDGFLEEVTNSAERTASSSLILSGFFVFSETSLAVQAITRRNGNFLMGLTDYASKRPVRLLKNIEWLDFGHANTYYQSRQRITTEREFNILTPARRSITKSGRDCRKIEAEAKWFEALPSELRVYAPTYLGRTDINSNIAYTIEYLNQSTLADLFVFGRLPDLSWERIFSACDEFLLRCRKYMPDVEALEDTQDLYLGKTLTRLEDYSRISNISLQEPCRLNGVWLPSLLQIATSAADRIAETTPELISFIHGDFCFSNIMFDFRAEMIQVIDPRGLDGSGAFSVYGDIRYDLGKLYHSVIGRYDHIIAGYYSLQSLGTLNFNFEVPTNEHLSSIEATFKRHKFAELTMDQPTFAAIATLLFLSMLPLHSDDPIRQNALLANAMRLFLDLEKNGASK